MTFDPLRLSPQERLEQERKEKKKQKEKERKERLKKEGKLLTKAQREARARAEATLKLLQAQGERLSTNHIAAHSHVTAAAD